MRSIYLRIVTRKLIGDINLVDMITTKNFTRTFFKK